MLLLAGYESHFTKLLSFLLLKNKPKTRENANLSDLRLALGREIQNKQKSRENANLSDLRSHLRAEMDLQPKIPRK